MDKRWSGTITAALIALWVAGSKTATAPSLRSQGMREWPLPFSEQAIVSPVIRVQHFILQMAKAPAVEVHDYEAFLAQTEEKNDLREMKEPPLSKPTTSEIKTTRASDSASFQRLITELWIGLKSLDETAFNQEALEAESYGFKAFRGDEDTLREKSFMYVQARENELTLNDYANFLTAINRSLENLGQHGNGYGILLLRFDPNGGEYHFILLDQGAGFISRSGAHVPIEHAVKENVSMGRGGRKGFGLTDTVQRGDRVTVTTFHQDQDGAVRGYYWEKGMTAEVALDTILVPHGTKVEFQKQTSGRSPAIDDRRTGIAEQILARGA